MEEGEVPEEEWDEAAAVASFGRGVFDDDYGSTMGNVTEEEARYTRNLLYADFDEDREARSTGIPSGWMVANPASQCAPAVQGNNWSNNKCTAWACCRGSGRGTSWCRDIRSGFCTGGCHIYKCSTRCPDGYYCTGGNKCQKKTDQSCIVPCPASGCPSQAGSTGVQIYSVKRDNESKGNGAYFVFRKDDWTNKIGSWSNNGQYTIKQCRNGAQVNTNKKLPGRVVIWDNQNGVHGRYAEWSDWQAGDWQVGDVIVKSSQSCPSATTWTRASGFCTPRPPHCKTNKGIPTEADCKALTERVGGISYIFAKLYSSKLGHCEVGFDASVKTCPAGVNWYQNYWLGQERGYPTGGDGNSQWTCGYKTNTPQ